MEWYDEGDHEFLEVDIGYVPRMEIISRAPSAANGGKSASGSVSKIPKIEWEQEISVEEADSFLERSFFPFKEVDSQALS